MTESTRPRMARGRMLPVGILAAALFALLAFAPFASAAPDPIESGNTTLTMNNNWFKNPKTFGIKIQKVKPGQAQGQEGVPSPSPGGEMDPTNGLGTSHPQRRPEVQGRARSRSR